MKKGGRILIVDFFKDSKTGPPRDHKLALEIVIEELKESGLTEFQIDTKILEQQYIVIVDVL